MRTQSTRTPELLAPAGGLAQLEAALRFGADAVYLAADRFGLRQRAANFALDDVPAAAARAHDAGAKAYATLNALMDADDLKALPAYLEALAAAGVDAFIVSDLGALRLAQRHAPNVELHVSTQASVCNAEAARVWHELGASRVVCAREMSVEDIARLRAGAPRELELEAFVHGAMCMAVSGRCLISAALTGRSGNKGHCTQPCRWSYALVEEQRPGEFFPVEEDVRGTYVMNAQDLNMLAHLDDLAAAGIDSFKIEGRNKKAFYVASVVRAYRLALDRAAGRVASPVRHGLRLRRRQAVARRGRLHRRMPACRHGGSVRTGRRRRVPRDRAVLQPLLRRRRAGGAVAGSARPSRARA